MQERLGQVTARHCGAAVVRLGHCEEPHPVVLSIAVRCRLGSRKYDQYALLDTGAAWSVVSAEALETIADELGAEIGPVEMKTRHGNQKGTLHRLTISLMTDHGLGESLAVEATCAVMPEWPGPIILGFKGFLQRLSFTLDPGSCANEEPMLFFGPVSGC